MKLIIILRKTVPDKETGEALTEVVRTKLEDYPEVEISASVSESLND